MFKKKQTNKPQVAKVAQVIVGQDNLGNTPLHRAVIQNDITKAQELLKNQPNQANSKNYLGRSAIFYVKTNEMLEILLTRPDCLTIIDNEGLNPAAYNEVIRKHLENLKSAKPMKTTAGQN